MQVPSPANPAAVLDDLVRDALPDERGLGAWRALLHAHASLMRELSTDLAMKTRLPLGDFDVLAQLALAGGELRMTELATKAFSSRSAMTRRVDRMIGEGFVRRTSSEGDGRGVLVALTEAGLARLTRRSLSSQSTNSDVAGSAFSGSSASSDAMSYRASSVKSSDHSGSRHVSSRSAS